MIKTELIKKSPVRVFEETLNGGLGQGNLGVITARKGIGKTATLVHLAIDKLMRGKNVLHISFADDPRHIHSWYNQVFNEIVRAYKLENQSQVLDDLIRHRLILHFKQTDISFEQIKNHINELTKGMPAAPDVIIIDGFPWEDAKPDQVENWQTYATENKVAIWFSATLHREKLDLDDQGIPYPVNKFVDQLRVIIMLQPEKNHIDLQLLKKTGGEDIPLRLKLDPHTLLLANHRV